MGSLTNTMSLSGRRCSSTPSTDFRRAAAKPRRYLSGTTSRSGTREAFPAVHLSCFHWFTTGRKSWMDTAKTIITGASGGICDVKRDRDRQAQSRWQISLV